MGKRGFDFDHSDYGEVIELFIEEELCLEDIEDGIEPEELLVRVCLTGHACERMYNTFGRQTDRSDIEDLVYSKKDALFTLRDGEDFYLINDERTLALPMVAFFGDGSLHLVAKTVTRNVSIQSGVEIERKVRVRIDGRVL